MPYAVVIEDRAAQELADLPRQDQRRVLRKIEGLVENPMPPGCVAMHGASKGMFRIRIGDYRVIYNVIRNKLTVLVVKVGHRRDVYR